MKWLLVFAPVLGLAVNVLTQIASFRLAARRGLLNSLLFGFFVGASVAGALAGVACAALDLSREETICQLLWALLTVGALGYGYFHFINLGETARRVRILREFAEGKDNLTATEVLDRYNARMIVNIRLQRLVNTGQVSVRDGRYHTGRGSVLLMARIIEGMKLLILGKRSEFDR